MKRTHNIDLGAMRKAPKSFAFKPLAFAVTAGTLLAGCSDNSQDAQVFTSEDDCISNNPDQVEQCQLAYREAVDEAVKSGPKYSNMNACVSDFGAQNCTSYTSSNNQSFFMPLMAGYMLSSLVNGGYRSAPLYTSYSRNSPAYGKWSSTDGSLYGSANSSRVRVNNKAFNPKPAVKRTMSRGGFGSKISAKSSFGGKSSRSSWGG